MEVEREIKKMTLGHDFGAGAACLKCRDKCEGFELHFWRKICRNCKCGLTDHDVQMNSEENKKVGKLFEDTKYTGLIAKLKTDGVPTYRGNMVTISLPSTGTAYVMPPSASSSVVMPPGATTGSAQPTAAHSGVPGYGVPGSGVSVGGVPGSGVPGRGVSFGGVPGHGVPGSGVPGSGVPGSGVPGSGVPGSGVPGSGVPGSGVAGSGLPGSGLAGSGGPGSGLPGSRVAASGVPARAQAMSAGSFAPVRANAVPIAPGAMSANLVPVKNDVPMKSVTYEWAPPVANQYLAVRYIELLPPEKRPVAGTEGAAYRRQQMACQLPEHDQDPALCHELSPAEVKKMQQFVRKYKDEALGVGDVRLPEEMALVRAQGGDAGGAGGPRAGAAPGSRPGVGPPGSQGAGDGGVAPGGGAGGAGSRPGVGSVGGLPGGPGAGTGVPGDMATAAPAGAMGLPGAPQAGAAPQNYNCSHCERPMRQGEPAVYAERAGYDRLWHPACFVCCTCQELLVDMIYFWKRGKLYCGRHYGDSEKPRCGGCDELIFCNEYTQAEGQNWHLKHFCCFECDCILAGETYVMEKDKPVCKPCYMNNYAVKCRACQNPVEPEAQRVSYGEDHWHADPQCFQCSGCSKCLVGERFMAVQGLLFCSVDCKKKMQA